jgi:hypothetical protein
MSSDRRTTWLTQRRFARRSPAPTCGTAGFFEFVLVPAPVSARQKGGSGPSVSASKNSVPDSDVRDRFDDWVVGLQFVPDYLHHPVSANRAFPARRQIARFCGDFRPLISRIFVSASVHAFEWRFLAPCLRMQKFRSRRAGLESEVQPQSTRNFRRFALP